MKTMEILQNRPLVEKKNWPFSFFTQGRIKRRTALSLLFFVLTVAAARAGDEGYALEDYLCTVFKYLTGTVGKALAAFACVGVSLAFVAGKLAWTTVLTFAIGMACIFGAPQIVKAFSGGELACSTADDVNSNN
ncbi:MAG: TrbC/VirB2 family protein [Rickettsiales bacterium]|jgi:type IV secretory pathway VirB2 component (pilin)|nr:TrbC/VirB2 family protein [Rickettsiales bacterium]